MAWLVSRCCRAVALSRLFSTVVLRDALGLGIAGLMAIAIG